MNANFPNCLELLLINEGGYQDDPRDMGNRLSDGRSGATNLGVTQAVMEEWLHHPVTNSYMRNLTPANVAPIYKRKYWDACRADELMAGLDYVVFDTAVNSGPGRSIKMLQTCVGTVPDGGFGSVTMAAVSQFKGDSLRTIINEFCDSRADYLRTLKLFPIYGKGWLHRVEKVRAQALEMVS